MMSDWAMSQEERNMHIVLAMLTSKAHEAYLAALQAGISDRPASIYAVPIDGNENALPPAELAAAARKIGLSAAAHDNPAAALAAIDDPNALIIIAGSLYLAGDVLRHHG